DVLLLCSNLIHKLFDKIQNAVPLPMLHIADAIADTIKAEGYATVALLGAKPTMEEDFYKSRIEEKGAVKVIIPSQEDRNYIDTAIFGRMCRNIYTEEDREKLKNIIAGLQAQGAQAVIFGCTELPVLLDKAPLPILNSTYIHSIKAVDWALVDHKQEGRHER
ncbi:MAG: amino acid racemase, partial [Bdellovibrionales bacterium]